MSPHILFVGAENAGSWQVRGVQIASALGARATLKPTQADWRWADAVVLVKRAIDAWGHAAKQTHLPVIWDALDYWNQPDENDRSEAECRADLRRRAATVTKVIGATRAMAQACDGVYIPHQSRPGLRFTLSGSSVVAYEGTPKYLGAWRGELERTCASLGVQFVVNPPSLSDADVVVAFRDGKWDGWACREWKSGVKYVNALVAGRPVITQRSAGFVEVPICGRAITTPDELPEAIEEAFAMRKMAAHAASQFGRSYSLQAIAHQYRSLVSSVLQVPA